MRGQGARPAKAARTRGPAPSIDSDDGENADRDARSKARHGSSRGCSLTTPRKDNKTKHFVESIEGFENTVDKKIEAFLVASFVRQLLRPYFWSVGLDSLQSTAAGNALLLE